MKHLLTFQQFINESTSMSAIKSSSTTLDKRRKMIQDDINQPHVVYNRDTKEFETLADGVNSIDIKLLDKWYQQISKTFELPLNKIMTVDSESDVTDFVLDLNDKLEDMVNGRDVELLDELTFGSYFPDAPQKVKANHYHIEDANAHVITYMTRDAEGIEMYHLAYPASSEKALVDWANKNL